jgi:hypothetical protein
MAHTDKTDPFWVNIATGYYKSEEVHDHRFSECDLPSRWDRLRTEGWHAETQCYWNFVWDGRQICACSMCHGAYHGQYGEYSARRDRHQTRVDVLRWKAEYNGSGEIQEW